VLKRIPFFRPAPFSPLCRPLYISLRRQIHPCRCTRTRTSRAKQSTPTRTQASFCRARNTHIHTHTHTYTHTYTHTCIPCTYRTRGGLGLRDPRTYTNVFDGGREGGREVLKLADRSASTLRVCSERDRWSRGRDWFSGACIYSHRIKSPTHRGPTWPHSLCSHEPFHAYRSQPCARSGSHVCIRVRAERRDV